MAEEAKHLETARADRPVWLMKCPTVVSRAWQEAASASTSNTDAGGANPNPNPNPVVAKVVLSIDLLREERPTQFKLEMAQVNSGNTPKSYSLNMYNDFVPMCIFSESNQGKYSCDGKVENKFDMKPHSENLAEYGKLCRARTTKFMDKPRRVEVLVDDHGSRMRPMPGIIGLRPSTTNTKEKKKLVPPKCYETKRTRRGRTEMENILFKLFERQPNWSLKQLMQETDQPEMLLCSLHFFPKSTQRKHWSPTVCNALLISTASLTNFLRLINDLMQQFLKEILNDLCVYNKRGPNQGTHELKIEYKKSSEDNSAT